MTRVKEVFFPGTCQVQSKNYLCYIEVVFVMHRWKNMITGMSTNRIKNIVYNIFKSLINITGITEGVTFLNRTSNL
jgi:hypothetical protein